MQTSAPAALPTIRSDLKWTVHERSGQPWYSVCEPASCRWFRLGWREYTIVSRMGGMASAESLVAAINLEFRANSEFNHRPVTQEEVAQLAKWLVESQLIQTNRPMNPAVAKPPLSISPLYMQVPLISGHRLERIVAPIAPILTRGLAIAIVMIYLIALGCVLSNWKLFSTTTSEMFVADGQLWWLVAWLMLKASHELGHAAVAVKVKSQIRSAGLSFIFFAPVPYVDVSDLWSISSRWHRIAVSAAGILVELAIASVAALIAVNTTNDSVRYLCCAIATMGTVTTLAFNASPLMRFDGYFIFSDLLNIPNLWTQSSEAFKAAARRILSPFRPASKPFSPVFALYGGICFCYRISVLFTVAATAILLWESIGVAVVLWGGYAMFLTPWLRRRRQRALARTVTKTGESANWLVPMAVAASLAGLLALLPSPFQPSAPGVVTFYQPTTINSDAQGVLTEIHATRGQRVHSGDLIAVLSNPLLERDLKCLEIEVQLAREKARLQQSRGTLAQLQAENARVESLIFQFQQQAKKVERLQVRAPHEATIVALPIEYDLGRNVTVGQPICLLAPTEDLETCVSVSQKDAEALRGALGQTVRVHLPNNRSVPGTIERVDPKGSDLLGEPLLAASYGGPIPVEMVTDAQEGDQLRLASPRFDAHIRLEASGLAVPGEMTWISIPGKRLSLWTAIGDWIEQGWAQIKHSIK